MVKALITIFALLATTVNAGAMATCGEQSDCIKFSTPEETSGTCTGDCEFKVCLDLSGIGSTSCVKKDGTVSHSCVLPSDVCAANQLDFTGATETPSLTSSHVQCQTGKGGEYLYFLLKDGRGCSSSTDTTGVWPPGSLEPKATCQPTAFAAGSSVSCTGNGSGVECVWSYKLPTCTAPPPPPPPPPPANCPKGNGVCYTTDCQCVLGSCKVTESPNFTSVLVGYTSTSPDGWYSIKSTCESGQGLSNAVLIPSTGICKKEEPEGQSPTFKVQVIGGKLVTPFSMKCGQNCYVYDSTYGTTPVEFPWYCNQSVKTKNGFAVGTVAGSTVGGIAAAVAMVAVVIGVFVYKKRIGKSAASENDYDVDTVISVLTPRRSGDDN